MSYTFRYINRQQEPSYVSYTLIIEDVVLQETHRIEKTFKCGESVIDSEYLQLVANTEIVRIMNEKLIVVDELVDEVIEEQGEPNGDINE